MVYVLNQDGQPIMPTVNHAKVRVLLKKGKAKVFRRCPFTIQLLYPCDSQTQPISLGVDAGSKHIGVSATTKGDNTGARIIKHDLPKEHYVDARCISDYPEAIHPWNKTVVYYQKKVRRHNRQIHKMSILKGGVRKLNQAEYVVKGYRLFDKVQYHRKEYIVFGRRSSGFFDIRTLDGEKVNKGSINYKKLRLLEISKGFLIERKVVA